MESFTINGETFYFYEVKYGKNGSSRIVVDYGWFINDNVYERHLTFDVKYRLAKRRAEKAGFKVYRGKDFKYCFITRKESTERIAERVMKSRNYVNDCGFELEQRVRVKIGPDFQPLGTIKYILVDKRDFCFVLIDGSLTGNCICKFSELEAV